MAARKGPAYTMSAEHRTKIANSQILKCLVEHAEGIREMSSSQVTAGLGLLKKVMPDLQSMTLQGDDENPINFVTRVELVAKRNDDSADRTPAQTD